MQNLKEPRTALRPEQAGSEQNECKRNIPSGATSLHYTPLLYFWPVGFASRLWGQTMLRQAMRCGVRCNAAVDEPAALCPALRPTFKIRRGDRSLCVLMSHYAMMIVRRLRCDFHASRHVMATATPPHHRSKSPPLSCLTTSDWRRLEDGDCTIRRWPHPKRGNSSLR